MKTRGRISRGAPGLRIYIYGIIYGFIYGFDAISSNAPIRLNPRKSSKL
jgi:hypothetical protein